MSADLQGFLRRVGPWVPAISWAVFISFASTDALSATHTSRIVLPLLRWLLPLASPETLEHLHFYVRKAAHFSEYFVFSLLLVRGIRGKDPGWKLRWAIWAILIAAGYAAFDEFHQSFVPSRGASAWDSLIDACGATTAQVALWLWIRVQSHDLIRSREKT